MNNCHDPNVIPAKLVLDPDGEQESSINNVLDSASSAG